jgi:hypothetical protein
VETEYNCPHCGANLTFDNLLNLPSEYSCDFCNGEFVFTVIKKPLSHQTTDFEIKDVFSIALEIGRKRKIGAIKALRNQVTGLSLRDSKDYIDKYIPMETPEGFDYQLAAQKFVGDHSPVDFIDENEMEI